MSLWDVRAEGWGEVLVEMESETRGEVSLEILRGSLDFFRPSFDQVFSSDVVQFVRSALALARPGGVDRTESDAVSSHLDVLAKEDPAIGTASLAAAISLFFDCASTDFDTDTTLEIMSACYEAVLHTEGLSQEALDAETDNEHCSSFIDFQWAVMARIIAAK